MHLVGGTLKPFPRKRPFATTLGADFDQKRLGRRSNLDRSSAPQREIASLRSQ
jgi:hypothetical protein